VFNANGSAACSRRLGGVRGAGGGGGGCRLRLRSLEAGLLLKQMAGINKRLDHLGASPMARAACGVIQQV